MMAEAKGFKAIVNPDTRKVYSIVSKDYKLIRHQEAIDQVNQIIAETPDLGRYSTSMESYNDGGRIRVKYRFDDIKIKIQPDDPISPEINLLKSYDTSWPFFVHIGAFRYICSNGLVAGNRFSQVRKRHIFDLNQKDVKEEVSTVLSRLSTQSDQWRQWAKHRLTEQIYEKIMKTLRLGKKASETITERSRKEPTGLDDGGFPIITMWAFFNILTWYITYRATSLNHRVEMERRPLSRGFLFYKLGDGPISYIWKISHAQPFIIPLGSVFHIAEGHSEC